MNPEIRSIAEAEVRKYMDIARNTFLVFRDKPDLKVSFDLKGTCAGKASFAQWTVWFNPVLLEDNLEDYLRETFAHEVAHVVSDSVYGPEIRVTRRGKKRRMAHGNSWKAVMRVFGVAPERTHSMDVSKVRGPRRTKTKYEYVCQHCGKRIPVGPKHHKDLQSGREMHHRGCGRKGKLVFAGSLGKVTFGEAAKKLNTFAPEVNKPAEPVRSKPAIPGALSMAPMNASPTSKIGKAMFVWNDVLDTNPNATRADIVVEIQQRLNCTEERAKAYAGDIVRRIKKAA